MADHDSDALVQEHYAAIYRLLLHLTRRVHDAEDLAQQTFVRALRNLDKLRDDLPARSWLYAIAYREFLNWRRRRLWLPLTADRTAPGDAFARVADSDALLMALAKVKPDGRVVFLLHYVEEQSIQEIAKLLNIPEGTVKSRLHSARAGLKDLLTEEECYVPEFV